MNTDSLTQSNLIGMTIGNYQVVKPLGAGAMGEVFMAEHPQIGRRVAIKVLSPILSATEDMVESRPVYSRSVLEPLVKMPLVVGGSSLCRLHNSLRFSAS